MANYLGIDTSNYTTSIAIYERNLGLIDQRRQILKVKEGMVGLRQNDAVFQHIKIFPRLIESLFENLDEKISAVGVSTRPCDAENSYMPCFVVGDGLAKSLSTALRVDCYEFSHQAGHIAAVLFGANRLDLLKKQFIAFHVSGGTTQAVLVTPHDKKIFKTKIIAESLDLKAGQLIDRVGVKLGFQFPCGPKLEELALTCKENLKVNPCVKNFDCCLSGAENIVEKMMDDSQHPAKIALYTIEFIKQTLKMMCQRLFSEFGEIPIVFSGGVMSNKIIRREFEKIFNGIFADPQFSSDNAVGISILTSEVCKLNGKF